MGVMTAADHRIPRPVAEPIFDPSAYADGRVFETYRWLRANEPLGVAEIEGVDPFWVVTRHADILEISRQNDVFHNGDRSPTLVSQDADRMVREYVDRLYAPAARAHRAATSQAARELAVWKARLRGQWQRVAIDHVEAGAVDGTHRLGASLPLRVQVRLGELEPGEVDVQVVAGRVDQTDRITDPVIVSLKPAGHCDGEGRWLYEGPLALDRTGPFGYTVRVLPSHPLMASVAELGLIAVPPETAGMTAGVLR